MQSRKDLLQAHRLMTQRAALALLQGEPDPPDQPLRRLNMGLIASILVTVMAAAGFGVWGLLAPGNATGLTAAGTLIIDRETGTSYIWCQHHRLCPAVNYASARLALGLAQPAQRLVTQASLARYPRGPMIGIPGLPQPLPDGSSLVGGPWSVCVQTVTSPGTLQSHAVTTLVAGSSVGGRPLQGGTALLVRARGSDWLIWQGKRLPVPQAQQPNVLTALGTAQPAQQVPAGWLDALPEGPSFGPPFIPGFGHTARVPGAGPARIGAVFHTGAGSQHYVLLRGGFAPITQTQQRLLDAAPHQVPETAISPSVVAGDRTQAGVQAAGLPATMPSVAAYPVGAPLCEVYSGPAAAAPSTGLVTAGGSVPSYGIATNGAGGVDKIALPPGKAALAAVVATPAGTQGAGAPPPTVTGYFLVTGGHRYGLASPGVAAMLGYRIGARVLVPAGVADLIPAGPALDPALARNQVTG